MSVSTTVIEGAGYTWATAGFAWNSATAKRSWGMAKTMFYDLKEADTVALAETIGKGITRASLEALRFAELLTRGWEIQADEALQIAETYIDNIAFMISVLDSIAISESRAAEIVAVHLDGLRVGELMTHLRAIDFDESMGLADEFMRAFVVARAFADNIAFAEQTAKAMGVSHDDALALVDEFLRKANAVISDMLLATGEITEAEFADLLANAAPPGFDKFKPFVAGDYEYERALFKHLMIAENADRPRLSDLVVAVDVPDVTDRGQATLLAETLTVSFGRKFTRPPEVAVTLRSTTATGLVIPRVVEITNTYFKVECRDGGNSMVDAIISWIAHGC